MKNKITFLIAVFVIFSGLVLFINFNSKSAKKQKAETERIEENKKAKIDSIKQENEKNEILKRIEFEKDAAKKRIDGYLNKHDTKLDIAVLILDDNGQFVNELSSSIATIYRNQGQSVTSSLFTTSFIQSKYLSELRNANSQVLDMLNLNTHVNFIALGKISYSFRKGTLGVQTIICIANIEMSIISANQKTLNNSFSFFVNGNGVSKSQAREEALRKLVNKYIKVYSFL